MISRLFIFFVLLCTPFSDLARAEDHLYSPHKPKQEELLKPKSLSRIFEDYDIVTNSEWTDSDDFHFVNGVYIRTPLKYSRPLIMDYSLYPRMSSAIHKFKYDPKTHLIEIQGESHGLKMHSWVHVDDKYWDVIHYKIVKGDMKGFKIDAYLWEKEGKTLAIATGLWPKGRKMFSGIVALVFKPASEIVIGVATKNFRSYIEEEYEKKKKK